MKTYTVNIFIEMDNVLKRIDDYNYQSYNQLFFEMLNDINRVKRNTIFILRDRKSKKVIKKYFHEDIFEHFEIITMENSEKIQTYIIENNVNIEESFAILSSSSMIESFRESGIYTAYLKISENDLSEAKGLEIVDYQKAVFTNLFDINYENLIFESQKFNTNMGEETNEDDI